MPLSPGKRLGPYEILAAIGAGGMGVVYRARDTRLNRDVAIKVCAAQFSERFEREARAVAALNHPHICTLHDVGPDYLVMELVEGPTLAARIADGPIPIEEALVIARQIAEALEMLARKVPLFAAQPGDGNRALPFQKSDHRCDRMLRGNRDAHVHLVRHQVPLNDLALLLPSQRVKDRAQLPARLAEDGFAPPFRHEHNLVLAVPF